jgi:DNA-binding NarL/FixJ family response regulator
LTVLRVMVVDDHGVVRNGLRMLLEADGGFDVVHLAEDGKQAVELAAEDPPDVVLMDLAMPVMDGVAATLALKAAHPDVRVVVLTSLGEPERIVAAIDAGADGYLFKHAEPAEIVEAIRTAHAGGAVLDPKAARAMLDARSAPAAPTLTSREQQVLDLVAQGLANKQIGRRLGITERTVKAHLTRIYQAIGVQDRTQAALWVQRRRM